jgi:hypothetical protein
MSERGTRLLLQVVGVWSALNMASDAVRAAQIRLARTSANARRARRSSAARVRAPFSKRAGEIFIKELGTPASSRAALTRCTAGMAFGASLPRADSGANIEIDTGSATADTSTNRHTAADGTRLPLRVS